MILGPISLLDCLVFVIFLIPNLLIQVGIFGTIGLVVKLVPFFGTLPIPPVSPC